MIRKLIIVMSLSLALFSCAKHPPMPTVDRVELERFMGDWYVIANIPTFIEEDAHNAVETYRMGEDGVIETTFRFRDGGFDGPIKTYRPKGFIKDSETNALWGMQFIWPIKADYRIVYIDGDYQNTVIARQARDYVWLMSRSPEIDDELYMRLSGLIQRLGYDVSKLQKVPQQWPESDEEDS